MIRLKDTPYQNTAAFLSAAAQTAEFYGFESLEGMPRAKREAQKQLPPGAQQDSEISFARKDERALPSAAKRLLAVQPLATGALLSWRTVPSQNGGALSFELHAAGIPTSIAEALLIVTTNAILKDAHVEPRMLSINNVGSSESSGRFVRDVSHYLRKHIESIAPSLRPRAASDPLGTLVQLIERGHPAVSRAPQAMEYLTEEERQRFWELLEYLEVFGIPYELNSHILGSRDCWTHALFEIAAIEAESGAKRTIAFGGRYDPLMSRLARNPYPSTMVAIQCEIRGSQKVKREVRGVPLMYFAHLGPEAKRKSLTTLEMLREAGIPVYHGIWHERIGEQIAAARTSAVGYILIMGHKEAVEGTILVREVATNSQEAVPLPELAGYLKRRRLGKSVAEKTSA
ncbi:MAG TPA: His/Gly/Thr/Pro-type tRNA ligase C-terminal domain-containing protein [Candidatus Paceibacterota bacterium]|nr:His/Gly/Thr/Pro-type tRNA ligase C-terminal domain-containing protein [Candidatus Paceibacterota bacterium]